MDIYPVITETESVNNSATDIVSVSEIGDWLNLSSSMVTAKTYLITSLIETAVEIAENYTWLSILQRTYRADYDLLGGLFGNFLSGCGKDRLILNRSPIVALSDITGIEYLSDDDYVSFDRGAMTAAGLYENTTESKELRKWASIYFRESVNYQKRFNAYKIRVTYNAGFTTVPASIKTAIKMIVASDWTNRGDCSDCGCDLDGYPVPCSAKKNLDSWAISKTIFAGQTGGCCGD